MDGTTLRLRVASTLRRQGFRIAQGRIVPRSDLTKDDLRDLHALAVGHRIETARDALQRHEPWLLECVAAGSEVVPELIAPRLVEVQSGTAEEMLFRYACLHWSIPVSVGYGRRLRFLIIDDHTQKLMGVLGLGDPVFSLAPRDRWVGWDIDARRQRMRHVMDAFVLGAVPPYSQLLCGKFIAMVVASDEVRAAFARKYRDSRSLISRLPFDGRLALVTTASALGRSSLYNRLKYEDRLVFQSAGYTRGWGEFHFSNGLYDSITSYALRYCTPTAKQERWGTGFRNRREVVRKCLDKIGLSADWLNHGVQREVFVVPLAANTREFLCGKHSRLHWHHQSADDMFAHFRTRWLLPRSSWDDRYKSWDPREWQLWTED